MNARAAGPRPRDTAAEAQRFVARIFRLRLVGLGTACIAIAAVLLQLDAGLLLWTGLALSCTAWPALALWRARRSREPAEAERRNLMLDSALGGFWIAVMQFNLVPSALLFAWLAADKVSVGGWRLLWPSLALQAGACLATSALLGFPFAPHSNLQVALLSLPFMIIYPLCTSWAAHRLSRRVARQNRMLDRLSRTDGLTGLANRKHWQEMAELEFRRSRRARRHSALLLLDVDEFKAINDRFGHPVGDLVLQKVGEAMRAQLRSTDTPGRFGGDEFGVVLVEIDPPDVRIPAERLRATIEALRLAQAPGLRVTVSIGACYVDQAMPDVEAWLQCADAALYAAKRAGRNRLAVCDAAGNIVDMHAPPAPKRAGAVRTG